MAALTAAWEELALARLLLTQQACAPTLSELKGVQHEKQISVDDGLVGFGDSARQRAS
jgi:hypothetical protein